MYETVRSQDRYFFQNEWLSAYWHFSFDHYYDPRHVQFGPLRVFNNDTIQPGAGFPTHSHQEMEIVTYVIDGHLEHKDSTGGIGTILVVASWTGLFPSLRKLGSLSSLSAQTRQPVKTG